MLLTELRKKIDAIHARKIAEQKSLVVDHISQSLASGKILCSVIEANDLQRSVNRPKTSLRPFVRVTVESRLHGTKPRKIGEMHRTDVGEVKIQENISSSWVTQLEPYGALLHLGQFKKNIECELDFTNRNENPEEPEVPSYDDSYLKFEVVHANPGSQDDQIVLGSALLQVKELIDLGKPETSKSLLLLTPKTENCGIDDYRKIIGSMSEDYYHDTLEHTISGTLKIKTLYIPDYNTRFNHCLSGGTNEIQIP